MLGTNGDIAALYDWTWTFDENFPGETPSAPGICYGPGTPG